MYIRMYVYVRVYVVYVHTYTYLRKHIHIICITYVHMYVRMYVAKQKHLGCKKVWGQHCKQAGATKRFDIS